MKKRLKPIIKSLHLEPVIRRMCVESRMSGERVRFFLQGRPDASGTILVAGSARSGTSWLGGILASTGSIQQIFEPLSPPQNAAVQQLTGWNDRTNVVRSYYLAAGGNYPEWQEWLERVLTGRMRTYKTDFERTSYWPDRYLIKGIRVNLMFGYVFDHFRPEIVYIVRHPCAVIYSRLYRRGNRLPWQASVSDILKQDALVEDYLRPWIKQIEQERDLLGAHAVWWAVENMVARRELESRHHLRVHYEQLVLNPEEMLKNIANWLNLNTAHFDRHQIRKNSRAATPGQDHSTKARLEGWRSGLSEEEQQRILYWARTLGITWYHEDPYPHTAENDKIV